MAQKDVRRKSYRGLFIPAGVLIGIGLGFLWSNISVYLFLGLGTGFLVWAIYKILRKK